MTKGESSLSHFFFFVLAKTSQISAQASLQKVQPNEFSRYKAQNRWICHYCGKKDIFALFVSICMGGMFSRDNGNLLLNAMMLLNLSETRGTPNLNGE